MGMHPLIELSLDRQVKQAKGFGPFSTGLTGQGLEAQYNQEVANAPKRHDIDKKHLDVRTVRIPSGPQNGKDDRHLAMAIASFAKAGGASPELPDVGEVQIVDGLVPLRTAAPDKARGDADPNKGVDDIDLLALLPDERVAVVCLKYLAPTATRGGAGDTPLRALLRGLAQAAMVDANRQALGEEIKAESGRAISAEAPALIIAASPRYWELCRKREAQKGAAWIREMDRLARECAEDIGIQIFWLALELEGDPPWSYVEDGPLLSNPFNFKAAWEPGAGKLKPKPKSRGKKSAPALVIVDANLDKQPRSYAITDSFEPGDRINHPSLGAGVVQGSTGRGKIKVLFGDDTKILVHERPGASAS